MSWNALLAEEAPLMVSRVGFLQGELRLYLRPIAAVTAYYVLQLEEVASFYDSLMRGVEIRISDRPDHGTFGWWLPADDPHHSVKIAAVNADLGFFLALARRIVYREAGGSESLNWPG